MTFKTPINLASTVFEPWTMVSAMAVEPMYITYQREVYSLFNLGVVCFVPDENLSKPISTSAINNYTQVNNIMASPASSWMLMTAPLSWSDLDVCKKLRAKPLNNTDKELMSLNTSYGVVTWYVRVNQVFDCSITFLRLEPDNAKDLYDNP